MKIVVNPIGRMINNYLMMMALPLAGWFIVEYLIRNAAASHLLLNLFNFPMMAVTLVAVWWIIRRLRRTILYDTLFGLQAWSFGVQLAFFSGLIEALFIYVYNQFINPGNLEAVQQAVVAQYEEVFNTLKGMGAYQSMMPKFQETLDVLKASAVPSPIEAAVSQLSNDILYAIIYMIPMAFILRKKPQIPFGDGDYPTPPTDDEQQPEQ